MGQTQQGLGKQVFLLGTGIKLNIIDIKATLIQTLSWGKKNKNKGGRKAWRQRQVRQKAHTESRLWTCPRGSVALVAAVFLCVPLIFAMFFLCRCSSRTDVRVDLPALASAGWDSWRLEWQRHWESEMTAAASWSWGTLPLGFTTTCTHVCCNDEAAILCTQSD